VTARLPWLALVACAAPTGPSETPPAPTSIVAGASSQPGGLSGWTLLGGSQHATWAIVGDGPASTLGGGSAIAVQPAFLDFGPVRLAMPVRRIITISNTGTDVLMFTGITISPPFQTPGLSGVTVAPGDAVDLAVDLMANHTGPIGGTLEIASNDPQSPSVMVLLTGVVTVPAIAVQPTSLVFGPQRVATTSGAQIVTIMNAGTDLLTIASVIADGPFVTPALSGLVIPPGNLATIEVQFAPVAPGPASGSLTIASDAETGPTIVPVTGIGTQAVLVVGAPSIDFGAQRVGTTTTKTFTVGNSGDAPLAISAAVAPAPFAIATPPRTVLPGGQVTLSVTFSPMAVGSALATAVVTTDAGVELVALGGIAVQPAVSATPSTIDYGDLRVGATSAATTVEITNPGSDILHVTAIVIPPGFQPTAPLPLPAAIAPNAALAFDVVFAPVAHASFAGVIAIESNAGPAAVAVTGRGVVPALVASLPRLEFGAVAIGASSSLAVQLSNPGDGPVAIAGASVNGSSDYAMTDALPPVIAPGASITQTIAFAPSDHGLRVARLTIANDTEPVSIDLTGTGIGPRAGVVPPALDFGGANVATTAPPRGVTVINSGDAPLVISAIVISGANASELAAITPVPVTVPAGAATTVAFSFTPSAVGPRSAIATLVTSDPLAPAMAVLLTGFGRSTLLEVGPDLTDFGRVNLGRSVTRVFTVTNLGTGPLTITSFAIGGADAAALSLEPVPMPVVVAPSSSIPLHVTFTPTAIGSAVATITVVSDDATAPVSFTGAGTAPSVSVAASDLDFGAQVVGHPSAMQQVHITNTGDGPLMVSSLAITGAPPAGFAIVSRPPLPLAIAAAGELVVSLRVTARSTGVTAADLEIKTDAAPATVSLTALGIAAGLSVSPATIDFGTTHPGTRPAPVTVTVSNLTSEPIQLVDAIRRGARPGDFTVSSVAGSLAPGGSTTAVVDYTPSTAASSAGTITFASTDTTIPQAIVSLGGKAVSTYITADRDTLAFGAIEVGQTSGAKTVSITNTTTAPLSLASIVSADPQFVATVPRVQGLAPGGTISFTVSFAPSTAAAAASTIAIALTGSATPELIVAVTGTGEVAGEVAGCSTCHPSSPWLVVVVIVGLCTARGRRRASAA